jgi:hypothetical protein
MRRIDGKTVGRIGRCALWLSGLTLVCAIGGLGCRSGSSAADAANKKRWEQWVKDNPPATNDLEAAYQRRQAQLAARRAGAVKAAPAAASPGSGTATTTK